MNADAGFEAQLRRWQPPRELARGCPRSVGLTAAGKIAVASIVALLVGAVTSAIWLYLAADRDAFRREQMVREGVSGRAAVVEVGRTGGEQKRHFAVYRYTSRGGQYQGKATFRRRDWQNLTIGSALEVLYLPSDPATSWLPGREPKGVPMWVVPLVPAVLVLATWPIIYVCRKQRRLLEGGRPALARVTRSEKFNTGHANAYHVYYEFRVMSGAKRTGRYDAHKKPPVAGETFVVLYDPDEPARHGRHPLSLVRTL